MIQTGGKYFLDLDPTLTEHMARHVSGQIAAILQAMMSAIVQFNARYAISVPYLAESLRSIKMHLVQG